MHLTAAFNGLHHAEGESGMTSNDAMTVRELIQKLKALPMEAKIVSYYNSGYSFVAKDTELSIDRLVDKRGYVDFARDPVDKALETECVILPA
jgi:hypothetical protein